MSIADEPFPFPTVTKIAAECAVDAFDQGSRAPWGDGELFEGDWAYLAGTLGRDPTGAEAARMRAVFCRALLACNDRNPDHERWDDDNETFIAGEGQGG